MARSRGSPNVAIVRQRSQFDFIRIFMAALSTASIDIDNDNDNDMSYQRSFERVGQQLIDVGPSALSAIRKLNLKETLTSL